MFSANFLSRMFDLKFKYCKEILRDLKNNRLTEAVVRRWSVKKGVLKNFAKFKLATLLK